MVKCNHCLVKSRGMAENSDWDAEVSQIVRKYALQNAIEYHGEGQSGSVLGRVLSEREDLRSEAKRLISLVENEVSRAKVKVSEQKVNQQKVRLRSTRNKSL